MDILDADLDQKVVLQDHLPQHLTTRQQQMLLALLQRHRPLFEGRLALAKNIRPIHITLKDGTQPIACRPYPIPHALEAATRREIERLVKIGVLAKGRRAGWSSHPL